MDGETKMIDRNRNSDRHAGANRSIISDVIELTELQCELFVTDSRQLFQQWLRWVIVLSVGVAMLVGTVPVGLAAAAICLHQTTGLSWLWSFTAVGVAGIVIAVVCIVLAAMRMANRQQLFQQSKAELRQNLATIKKLCCHN